jgi:uncharacterized protein YdcH (DUF465 family)
MSKKDPYENVDAEFFDGLIEGAENEMNTDFNTMRAIKKQKYTTDKIKQTKCAPLIENITMNKEKILNWLMIKNQKINWFNKLPQDHQFYKHFITIQGCKTMDDRIAQKIEDNQRMYEEAVKEMRNLD